MRIISCDQPGCHCASSYYQEHIATKSMQLPHMHTVLSRQNFRLTSFLQFSLDQGLTAFALDVNASRGTRLYRTEWVGIRPLLVQDMSGDTWIRLMPVSTSCTDPGNPVDPVTVGVECAGPYCVFCYFH